MAHAICTDCGKEVPWRAKRGCRLADQRCPYCGGKLTGKTKGQKGSTSGRKMETCVVCGKRAFLFLHPRQEYRTLWGHQFGTILEARQKVFPAGSPCCSGHEPIPKDFVGYSALTGTAWQEAHDRQMRFLEEARGKI